ncbi:Aspartate/glutamate/uridylate kinase [Obelidium mucronatum]|nr:Aspartate/glutamate/uridylate kinase [Obelidium mucronatum]
MAFDSHTAPPKNPRVVPSTTQTGSTDGLTVVIKLGTSSIVNEKTLFPKMSTLSLLIETVHEMRQLGHRVILVSSGAVGMGLKRLNLTHRPQTLQEKQAVAAVGQGRLMALYDDLFGQLDIPVAQVLLTKDVLAERAQYINACNTFKELLNFKTVPIVNENDTVSNTQIRFGDNDTLSAITAGMVNADYLFLCTDVECLYTDNPRTNPDAKAVKVVEDIASLKVQVSSPGSSLGTGGMVTKLIAAELATAAGCSTIITIGSDPKRMLTILDEMAAHHRDSPSTRFEPSVGTLFLRKPNPMVDRKWWILHGLADRGCIYVDEGAASAIKKKMSLFAAGIVDVEGTFSSDQTVRVVCRKQVDVGDGTKEIQEVEIGKGLVNYGASEVARIKGLKSYEIHVVLGYISSDCVIHRHNFVMSNK